jgi:hypothetical protein
MKSETHSSVLLSSILALFLGGALSVHGQSIEFNRDVRPVLADHCFPCHGPDQSKRKADLRLDMPDGLTVPGSEGAVLVPGDPGASLLIQRVLTSDPDLVMPPPEAEHALTDQEKERLSEWVRSGAVWDRHWSFIPPRRRALPQVERSKWPLGALDHFVLAKLESMDRQPLPLADARTLIRRLYLDLTGLPPSIEEVESFVQTYSEASYDDLVLRLLASPHFGERMTLPWLDAARYADTHGYQNDGEREMWPWRDWVIDAFNANMPFDQFTIEQLAGDLLPDATLDQRIATGFNRNHRYNSEGGSIPEEVLVENVADRVETTATTWLGLTIGCARCHDHKYDPLTMDDYYGLFAFFHNVPETGRAIRDGNSEPYIHAPNRIQREHLTGLKLDLAHAESRLADLDALIDRELEHWRAFSKQEPAELSFLRDGLVNERTFETGLGGFDAKALKSDLDQEGITWCEGVRGKGIQLDGNWSGSLGDIGRFNNMTPYSIGLWVRVDDNAGGAVFSRIEDGVGGRGFQLVYDQGHLEYLSISQGYAGRIGVRSIGTFPAGQWYHVMVTYDASLSARGIEIFVDGKSIELDITRNNDSNPGSHSSNPFLLGRSSIANDFAGAVDELRIYNRVLKPREIEVLSEPLPISEVLRLMPSERSSRQTLLARLVYLEQTQHPVISMALNTVRQAERDLQSYMESLPTVMIMQEMDEPRQTYVLTRGQYNNHGKPIDAGVPAILSEWNVEAPATRLGMARWLVSGRHPLTARVFVNRVWQMLFGRGLVETAEDFGVQGSLPSHPKLLDWLAVEFVESGWDVKRLIRTMVTSATYRQSSDAAPGDYIWDPDNQWLGRGPRNRLPAHFVRDQMLMLSGLVVDRLGGAPVYPYQPDDLWEAVSRKKYPESQGADLYRRSIYTYFKRTVAPPLLQTFDAADRESCIVRRAHTNTPLQALAAMNAPTLLEAAAELGRQASDKVGPGAGAQVDYLFERVLLRAPSASEQSRLIHSFEFYESLGKPDQQTILIELGKPGMKVSPETFPAFGVALSLLGLDETLAPR